MLYLSPDLKWANRTRMLDPTYNDAVVSVNEGDLTVTTDEDTGYIGHAHRVITLGILKYNLPTSVVWNLTGNNVNYIYTIGDGVFRTFVLRKSTGSV